MSRVEYDLLVEERPDLKLPSWAYLEYSPMFIGLVKKLTREEVIAGMTRLILVGKWPKSIKDPKWHP